MTVSCHVAPADAVLAVQTLETTDAEAWTRYVAQHPDANLYHTLEWRDVVRDIFGHQPLYLLCRRASEVTGVLPIFVIRFPLLRPKLISLPYDVGSGGALVTDDASEDALARAAVDAARALGAQRLELRCRSRRPVLDALRLQVSEPVIFSEMVLDSEAGVWGRVTSDHRKAIRKAERRGVVVREATTLAEFAQFDEIYLRVFRDFGTPPYGASYFPTLWHRLHRSGAVRLLLAIHEGRCVGGLVLFCWGKNLVSKFAACLPDAVALRAYNALYWHAICLGLRERYERLSWGTSSRHQEGLIDFKDRWGAQSSPVAVYSLPLTGRLPSLERYYDTGQAIGVAWRRLPLAMTRWVGGPLNRWFC